MPADAGEGAGVRVYSLPYPMPYLPPTYRLPHCIAYPTALPYRIALPTKQKPTCGGACSIFACDGKANAYRKQGNQ